jgi:hypothetical protein
MSELNDGGPAFPVQDLSKFQCYGMTLRDYFAAEAMQRMVRLVALDSRECHHRSVAENAYRMADAMLRARAKGEQE